MGFGLREGNAFVGNIFHILEIWNMFPTGRAPGCASLSFSELIAVSGIAAYVLVEFCQVI